jgi:DNA-binding beta-propeller fold protein YncE
VYVAHSGIGGTPQVAAYAYHHTTGALTLLPGSPFPAGSNAYNPRSLEVNSTGELLYMANGGTSNFSTFDISGTGTLTERAGSPTPAGSSPCVIHQPRLSPSLFVVSILASDVQLYGSDPGTGLPQWLDTKTMFSGSYCSAASDPYGKFVYLPNSGNSSGADYLFGFMTNANSTALLPLTLNSDPLSPANTYTLPALMPRAMVVRYSRRDREVLQVPD